MPDKAVQRQYILAAGALIAQERRDRKVAALMQVAAEGRIEMILPSAVLAQVWRGGARQVHLARTLRNPGLIEAPLRHDDAISIGELLKDSRTTDVVDAHVAVLARRLRAPVVTSDPGDLATLDADITLIRV
jgi:hypothetical protein